LTAARSLDAAAAVAGAGVVATVDGLAVAAVAAAAAGAGALGAVLAIAGVLAAGGLLATGLLTTFDMALGTVAWPVCAALPWLEQPVASVTRSVTPTTAAAAVPGVRRLTPVPS
jgi:hypothetical protein